MPNKAPAGQIWYCPMCGKASPTQSGWDEDTNSFVGEKGWDVSCAINSYLVSLEVLKRSRAEQHGN